MDNKKHFLKETIFGYATRHDLNERETRTLFELIFQQVLAFDGVELGEAGLDLDRVPKKVRATYEDWNKTLLSS